jgi:hypothetical protein
MTGRLFAMGNRLYFFEPHQAMPLHFYIMITKEFCRLLTEGTDPWVVTNLMNIKYRREIEELQDLIAINYAGENQLETPFWTYAKEKSRARLQGSRGFQDWATYVKQHGYTQYMYHGGELMREYIEGYKITL